MTTPLTLQDKLGYIVDLKELLDAWDDEWMYHYNHDEHYALACAVQHGGKGFESLVDEYLRG